VRLDKHSQAYAAISSAPNAAGILVRMRLIWAGDALNDASVGPWTQLKFVRR
jgi:hypothetical protein